MAQVANLKSNIQSKIQQDVNEKKKQLSASSTATKAGSTETPKVTDTPKVTQTAKAMPSVTPKLDLTPVSQSTTNVQPTDTKVSNVRDLFSSNATTSVLRKAATPDILSKKAEDISPVPGNVIASASTLGGDAEKAVNQTILDQFTTWFKETPEKVTQKVGNFFKEPVEAYGAKFESMINDTEYWVAGLADVIETSLGGEGGFKKAFQEKQGWFWDAYSNEIDIEGSKLYQEDEKAQQLSNNVSDWLWIRTGNKELSDTIGEVVGSVSATIKDPKQIAAVAGYMTPAIIMQMATGGGFLTNTAIWLPSQSTQVYKDFSQDSALSSKYTDNQLFGMSTAVGFVLSMIETFGDALGDMPWAKAMSRKIRSTFTKSILKKQTTKALNKEITEVVDKNLIKDIKQPILNALRKWYAGSIGEGFEEVAQDTLQTETAIALGSKRQGMSFKQALTTYFTAKTMGLGIMLPGVALNIKQNQDLQKQYNDFSRTVDKIAPGINEETKQAFFSAMITSQQNDANLSEKRVEKYEARTTALYNEISELQKQLENTTDENTKTKIQETINEKNNEITEIDKKINQWENTAQEINQYIEEYKKEQELKEESTQKEKQQLPKEAGGENLSEQTMKTVQDSGEVVQPTGSELQYKQATGEIETPTKRYINLIKKLNSKTTRYADSEGKEFKLKEDVIKELKYMSVDEGAELLSQYDSYSLKEILGVADRTLKSMKQGRNTRIKQDQLSKLYEQLSKGVDLKNQMVDELKSLKDKTKKEEVEGISDYRLLTGIGDFESARSAFSREKTIYGKHLVGLKDVSIKQLEGKITDKVAKKFSLMLAKASQILGIDFNKVIGENDLTLTVGNKDNVAGFFNRDWTKESLTEVLNELKNKGEDTSQYDDLAERTFKACIYLATLDDVSVSEATATLVHEFVHMLDYRRVIDLGLKAYINQHSKISRKGTWISSKEADYVLKGDKKRETFNNPEDVDPEWKQNRDKYDELMAGTIDLAQMTYDDVTYANEMLYIYDPTEIFARYAEQYYLWKNDKEMFDKYSKKTGYRSEEEFKKLIDIFENEILKDKFADYQIDEENRFYHDVMSRIYENKFKNMTIQFAENNNLNEFDVKQMLNEIEDEYAWIMQSVEGLKGDIKEEMIAFIQLTNLQTNYEMAKAKGQEYIDKLKTTPQQQDAIDNMTTETIPNPPQEPETLNNGIPYFGGSNIEEGLGSLMEGEDGEELSNTYMTETARVQARRKKSKFREAGRELIQAAKDVFTPAFSRIYNISPRVAGRLATMETQRDVNIYRYRQKAKGFVETLGGLKGKQALEVKMALLDYGALASEQGENIEEYKKQEVDKLKEVLLRNGFKEQDINDMFEVLDDIGRQYQDAGLSLTRTDMYFPRVVKDYEGLIDYMNRVSGKDIKVNKTSLMIKIRNIMDDINMTAEEKEARIRNAISMEFKQPGTTSQHGKERKMGLLSDWGEGIYAYYESPIESLDHYITTMVNATERQLFLGGMREDAGITENEILNMNTAESVSTIIGRLVENGQISENKVAELQKSIMAVLNKKPSPKSVTAIKDVTYISTITNFLSAINQLDDLGMVILKDKSGLKHIVKAIFGKAGIKYDELGLEDAYEMFREEGGITNWLFKKSFFNMFDRLGKTSFINTAWESMVHQSKNEKTRNYLYTRLQAMYGTESANRMMEKIDANNYMDESGQIDIEILRDLLYQLGSTQPIYTSAMPVTYLNNPWSRLCYALSSFTLKRIDWLIQGTKEVYKKNGGGAKGTAAAGAWLMYVSSFLAMFGAMIGDIGDFMKGDKEETFLWNLINEGIDKALAAGGSDMLDSWLKIWDLSEYDLKLYKQQGIWGLVAAKMKLFIFDLGKDIWQAVEKRDANEVTDLAKYVPIIGKLVYYWCWDELESATAQTKSSSGFIRRDDSGFKRREDSGFQRREETGFIRRG